MKKNRWLLRVITRIHRAIYLGTRGAIGGRLLWIRVLLLNHIGRKTGELRYTPLLYVEDGGNWVIVASNGGADHHPAWLHNLADRPRARVRVGREEREVTWRKATPEECERLWDKLSRAYPFYPAYRNNTSREIPLVVLEPAA